MEQYLRFKIQKRGITLIQHTYTGFDTEYETADVKKFKNKLISVKTAVQRRTIIKIPLYLPFDISYIHPLTSELSDTYTNKVDDVNGSAYKYTFRYSIVPYNKNESKIKLNELKFIQN